MFIVVSNFGKFMKIFRHDAARLTKKKQIGSGKLFIYLRSCGKQAKPKNNKK